MNLFKSWKKLVPLACIPLGTALFSQYAFFALNCSSSLPGHLYLVDKRDHGPFPKDSLIAFKPNVSMKPIPMSITVIKLVRGVPGDRIDVKHRSVFINRRFVSVAKDRTCSDMPLEPILSQTVARDYYYVHAPHPNSYDSRYRQTGLIHVSQILGRAYEVF